MHWPLTRASMESYRFRYWRVVSRSAREPGRAQRDTLRRLLQVNRRTTFGKAHGFDEVDGPRRFEAQVPIQQYETLRPYIEDQRRTGTQALTAEAPLFYAQTSGTTGTPKYIPITPAALAVHRAEQRLFSYLQFRACPRAFAGMGLGIMGAAVEGRLDSGHAVGSVSGHLYESLPWFVRSRFVVPPAVSSIANYELKYRVILHLALAQPGITYMGTPNPSTFLRLLQVLNAERDQFLAALATGSTDALDPLDPSLAASLARRLAPQPARAARLSSFSHLTFANVWPDLSLVTTWTGGSCGIALDALRPALPAQTVVMELGYQATEGRGTLPLEPDTAAGLPPLHHHYFEFIEQADWDEGRPRVVTLEALEDGRRYYVLLTTAAGLYRYFMNDLVEVAGRYERTPLLRFVQKGRGVTSITGEKLYEAQAIEAIRNAYGADGMPSFFILVADEAASAYRLLVEPRRQTEDSIALAIAIDARLGALNVEYGSKRDSGRLGPLAVVWLRRGSSDVYTAAAVKKGQREGQLKPQVLIYRRELLVPFEQLTAS
jgi:hypothetical protein